MAHQEIQGQQHPKGKRNVEIRELGVVHERCRQGCGKTSENRGAPVENLDTDAVERQQYPDAHRQSERTPQIVENSPSLDALDVDRIYGKERQIGRRQKVVMKRRIRRLMPVARETLLDPQENDRRL